MIDGPYGIKDVFLSLPAVIGRQGVHNVLALDLAPNEEAALIHSADVLRSALDDLGY
jgi:L-lactate dehydrogenase